MIIQLRLIRILELIILFTRQINLLMFFRHLPSNPACYLTLPQLIQVIKVKIATRIIIKLLSIHCRSLVMRLITSLLISTRLPLTSTSLPLEINIFPKPFRLPDLSHLPLPHLICTLSQFTVLLWQVDISSSEIEVEKLKVFI